jgi:tRNA dimethylallyltransferase
LFIADIVSAIGCLPFNAEEYNVDVAVAGSQKGLMCPPGLTFISLSDSAWDAVQKSRLPKFYFDFKKYKNADMMPYTPAVSIILGLNKALSMLYEEGIDNVLSRHKNYSSVIKNACKAMGLEEYPDEEFSVAVFREKAGAYIDEILLKNKVPIVVGGTGLYINSLIYSMDFTETISDWDYRNSLKEMAQNYGNSYVHEMLKDIDPDSYKRLHLNDLKRIIRALEVYKHTGKTISEFQYESRNKPVEYNYCMVGLTMNRQKLYERINKRVDIMIEKGLIDEVQGLMNMGYSETLISMQGLGYKEIITYLNGQCSLEEASSTLKQSTRHFGKRQLTWFRRLEEIDWVHVDEFQSRERIVENIISYAAGKINSV